MSTEYDQALVADPFLVSVLTSSNDARHATLSLHDMISPTGDPPSIARTTQPEEGDILALDPQPLLDEATEAQERLFALVSQLRGQNRRLAHLLRSTKSVTSASKSEIDRLHLSLQNLYYESRHLAGEISACEGFPHNYIQLPLISEDEFLEKFPQWQGRSGEDVTKARIENEYEERAELEEKRKVLVARRMDLVKENAKRKEELIKLDTDLEAFIEASKPIQKTFEKEY